MGKTYELRVDLSDGIESRFALYESFKIADESDKYRLTLGEYISSSNTGKPSSNISILLTKIIDK